MLAVIFDVDGTLIDSVDLHARAWQEALARFGFAVPYPAVRAQIGKGSDLLLPALVPEDALHAVRDRLDAFRKAHYRAHYLPRVRAFPGVRALFDRLLADGKRLALASSSPREDLAAYVEEAGIADLGVPATSADDVDRSKPHPDVFAAAVRLLDCPAPAVAVGDSPWDALSARRAGLTAVGLRCGGFPEVDLWNAGMSALYRDPQDLLERYEAIGDAVFEPVPEGHVERP